MLRMRHRSLLAHVWIFEVVSIIVLVCFSIKSNSDKSVCFASLFFLLRSSEKASYAHQHKALEALFVTAAPPANTAQQKTAPAAVAFACLGGTTRVEIDRSASSVPRAFTQEALSVLNAVEVGIRRRQQQVTKVLVQPAKLASTAHLQV
jgi:hypothetical protein